MAKLRRTMKHRKGSRKHHKGSRKYHKDHRKGSRKAYRRMLYGGEAPVNYSNPEPMGLNLRQGQQFAEFHKAQHGGAYGPYPGAVDQATVLPADLTAAARLLPLNAAFAQIRGMSDQTGGKRRRGKKASRKTRKHRKGSRKQRGGVLVRWGGGSRRRLRGGSYAEMRFPMPVGEEGKMLIPAGLQAQAGLNPEWKLAENPLSFAPSN